jgi:hypothetical protein
MYLGRMGSLSTLSRKHPGFPFGSVMPYGLDDRGRPIFLISTMAMHTQNLQADPQASLLVMQHDTEGDPLGASRVTLLGNVLPVPKPELAEARKLYLQRQLGEMFLFSAETASYKGGARRQSQRDRFTGDSILPKGMLFVFIPTRLVGDK